MQVRLKNGGREGREKGKNNILTSSFPLGKQKKKNGKGGREKEKGAKLLWTLLETLQPHAEETIIIEVMENFLTPSGSPRHRYRHRPSTSGTSTVSKSVMRERRMQRVEIAFATCCLCFCVDYLTGYLTTPESSVIHMTKNGRMERQTCHEFT